MVRENEGEPQRTSENLKKFWEKENAVSNKPIVSHGIQ